MQGLTKVIKDEPDEPPGVCAICMDGVEERRLLTNDLVFNASIQTDIFISM